MASVALAAAAPPPAEIVHEFNELDLPHLHSTLYAAQKRDVVELYRRESEQNAAIYVRQCGFGKTLTLLAACERTRDSHTQDTTLVVSPLAATHSWEKDLRDHFSPPLPSIVLSSDTKGQHTVRAMRKAHFVVINYGMLTSAYGRALKFREQIVDEEVRRLRVSVTRTDANTRNMVPGEWKAYTTTVQRLRDLVAYSELHKTKPNLALPLPEAFAYLRDREVVHTAESAFLALFRFRFRRLIVDEAHEARNEGHNFRALQQLHFVSCFAVTATPFNNSIRDLIALFRMTRRDPPCGWKALKQDKSACAAYIREQCEQLFVGHRSGTVAEQMREYRTTTAIVNIAFDTERERAAYSQIKEMWERRDAEMSLRAGTNYQSTRSHNILQTITALRQACDGETKLRAVCDYITRVVVPRGEKAVTYAAFINTATALAERLSLRHGSVLRVFFIIGRTPMPKRKIILAEFERHRGCAVLVATSRTIHLGVNLRAANHALVLNQWWNPVLEHQCVRRINRRLQTRSTYFVYFVMRNTVEESIWLVAQLKADINTRVMEADIDEAMLETVTSRSALRCTELQTANSRYLDPVVRCDNDALINELRTPPSIIGVAVVDDGDDDILGNDRGGGLRAVMQQRVQVVVHCMQTVAARMPPTQTIYTPPLPPPLPPPPKKVAAAAETTHKRGRSPHAPLGRHARTMRLPPYPKKRPRTQECGRRRMAFLSMSELPMPRGAASASRKCAPPSVDVRQVAAPAFLTQALAAPHGSARQELSNLADAFS